MQTVHVLQKVFILVVTAGVLACGNTSNKSAEVDSQSEPDVLYEHFVNVENNETIYKIPSPIELFFYLERNNLPFVAEALHSANKQNDYFSTYDRAINFGIYAADLGYSVVYGDQQLTLIYFDAVKGMAEKLGIYEGFGQQMANRIHDNLSNVDSLINITSASYHAATQYLEDQGTSDLLGLILVGGWVEGLYLTLSSIGNVSTYHPAFERVADQQILLENLMSFLASNKENESIARVLLKLEDLREVYDQLYFNDENTALTQKQYIDIVNKVSEIRNEFIH